MVKFKILALLLTAIFYSANSTGAILSFESVPNGNTILSISGDIEQGLYSEVIKSIKQRKLFPDIVWISSNGGDLEEAMKLGRLFRESFTVVQPSLMAKNSDKSCNSACAVIVLSSRTYVATEQIIGLHRPYFLPEHFGELSLSQAKSQYLHIEEKFREYLVDMGVKNSLIDKIIATPSDEAWFITMEEFVKLNGQPSHIQEWVAAQCPISQGDREMAAYVLDHDSFLHWVNKCPSFIELGKFDLSNPNCWVVKQNHLGFSKVVHLSDEERHNLREINNNHYKCLGETINRARKDFLNASNFMKEDI